MKTYGKHLFLLLLFAIVGIGSQAQILPAEWRLYSQKQYGNGYAAYFGSDVDSIKFTDTNYDVYAYTYNRGIKDDGRWFIQVYGSGALDIATLKVGVVSAEYSDNLIETMFLEGKLTDLHDVSNENNTPVEYIVEDGVYKAVAFGFDAQGAYKGFAVGQEETFTTSVDLNSLLLEPAIYLGNYHYDWGYGSLMHIRDVMGEEYVSTNSGFNWYRNWAINSNMGSNYAHSLIIWNTLDKAIESLEKQLDIFQKRSQIVKVDNASYGTALAMRSMLYLDAARMYEFLDNDGVSSINEAGNDVSGLTYPIGSSAFYKNDSTLSVKRATRNEMAAYILNDLNTAEEMLKNATRSSKLQADLSVIYGLKARLYMWIENYEQAKTYAGKAISEGQYTPLTESEWLDTAKGFNDSSISSWMWAMAYPVDSEVVRSGIINWVSWSCNEYLNGYTNAGAYAMIGKSIYDRISDTDFRKLSFKAPRGSTLSGREPHISDAVYDNLPDYASLKFRPGQGEVWESDIACVVDVPLMRIEEMYFIRCEADAMLGYVESAKERLNAFMKYRDANYSTDAADQQAIIDEIFLQKRIEFWGEGLNYFDYKRLNKPVTRGYAGTNFDTMMQFNTTTRPAWMNFVFVANAYMGAMEDWNNPNPSDCYTPQAY